MNIHPKVAMSGIGGAIAVIAIWVISLFGIYPPTEVCAAIATLCGFVAGYFTSSPENISVTAETKPLNIYKKPLQPFVK